MLLINTISKYLTKGKIYNDFQRAVRNTDPTHLDSIIKFTLRAVELDCQIGLALGEYCDEKYLDVETPLFDEINNMYRDAACGCYFCDNGVDPNAEEFTSETPLCYMCRLKLTKIAEYNDKRFKSAE